MEDEFKKIKFRNNGIVYTAHAIDLSNWNVTATGNFLIWTGAFRIYDEDDIQLVGKICFQQSTLLDYLWADPNKNRFPSKGYLEEALVNLLHYLPFDNETLNPDEDSFIFRFIRDLPDGREKERRFYNIKVEDSMEKTYTRKMFGEKVIYEDAIRSILEPLYMHRLQDYSTNLPIDLIRGILPFDQNKIDSHLEFLEYKKFIEILKDASGVFVSVKIRPEGVEFLTGITLNKMPDGKTTNKIQIGHNFNIKTGDNSPVNISADIDTSFESIKKEIKEKKQTNKEEILKDLSSLQNEIKNPQDIGKIKVLLGKIGKTANWVALRVEPIVQQVIASYISSKMPIPPLI